MTDPVKRPSHYVRLKPEPLDVIESWGLNYNLSSVIKYISRAGFKGPRLQDLQKAQTYLELEIKAEKKMSKAEPPGRRSGPTLRDLVIECLTENLVAGPTELTIAVYGTKGGRNKQRLISLVRQLVKEGKVFEVEPQVWSLRMTAARKTAGGPRTEVLPKKGPLYRCKCGHLAFQSERAKHLQEDHDAPTTKEYIESWYTKALRIELDEDAMLECED